MFVVHPIGFLLIPYRIAAPQVVNPSPKLVDLGEMILAPTLTTNHEYTKNRRAIVSNLTG